MSVHPREAARFSLFDDPDDQADKPTVSGSETRVDKPSFRTSDTDVVNPDEGKSLEAPVVATSVDSADLVTATAVSNGIFVDPLHLPSQETNTQMADTTSADAPTDQALRSDGGTGSITEGTSQETSSSTPARSKGLAGMFSGNVNVHARRRAAVVGALVALGISLYQNDVDVALPAGLTAGSSTSAATPQSPNAATQQNAETMLNGALVQARAHHDATGTYRGFVAPGGIISVTGNNLIVLSAVVNGSCWYSAVVPGYDNPPRWDATAARCNGVKLAKLQADIDATE